MGQIVNAAEAAQLAHVSERTIRTWLASGRLAAQKVHTIGQPLAWAIDVEVLGEVLGRRIDAEALARISAKRPTAARLEALEREVAALRAQVRSLQAQNASQRASAPNLSEPSSLDLARASYEPVSRPSTSYSVPPPALRMRHTSMGDTGTFDNRTVAARWLTRHGINENTPKSWPGWREVELSPRAVLELAMSLHDPSNWRITWRLHECDDAACVCHELLGLG